MKTQTKMKTIQKILIAALWVAGLVACTTDPVEQSGGKLPDGETVEGSFGILRSAVSADNTVAVLLTVGDGAATQSLYFEQTRPAAADASVTLRVDEELVATFNAANETACELLPAANYDFPDGTTLSVAAGKQQSAPLRISLKADGLTAGTYLLPVTVAAAGESAANQTVYYEVSIRALFEGDYPLDQAKFYPEEGEDNATEPILMVFYINTKDYDPRLVTDFYMTKQKRRPSQVLWTRAVGNIINLRTVVLKYDEASGRALLDLGSDMTHVLSHASTYIWPLQETGRKVCLSLEGGETGLGFCNLTDAQIADFVAQVETVVETYNLDGINLWDRNSGYGKEGMPEMNTTSYPKLIKAMREALGSDKLLTVTDHEEPTEYFWDMEATGNIAVGNYLDYAWSGYNSGSEVTQICDPWHPDDVEVSKYTHKPFAGLDPSKYGCINAPWYKDKDPYDLIDRENIYRWRASGNKQSQILVFNDLMTRLQGEYESTGQSYGEVCLYFADDGKTGTSLLAYSNNYMEVTSNLMYLPDGKIGYGKWLKDW